MPINSQCPHCKVVFNLDESFAGQHVVCTKCKNQYQVSANVGKPNVGQFKAPVAAPPTPSAPIINPPSTTRARRGGGGGLFHGPTGGSRFRSLLWLGLLLFVGTFAIKQMIVNYALIRTNSGTELARVELARQSARDKISYKANQLQRELNEMQFGDPAQQEGLQEKRDELNKLNETNRSKLDEVNKKYSVLQGDAQRNATASIANSLFLLKLTWWLKILLDLGKIAGCFLVLRSAFHIVCDRDEETPVKTFATVCAGITLTAILVMNVLTMMG